MTVLILDLLITIRIGPLIIGGLSHVTLPMPWLLADSLHTSSVPPASDTA
jgi:hypothetical protein